MLNNTVSVSLESGYVALLSTIIIGAVLLLATVELAASGWSTRFAVLHNEAKAQSVRLAQSCNAAALAQLLIQPLYLGDATSTGGGGICHVYLLQKNYPTAGMLTIKTRAEVNSSVTEITQQYNLYAIHQGDTPAASVSDIFDIDSIHTEIVTWSENY